MQDFRFGIRASSQERTRGGRGSRGGHHHSKVWPHVPPPNAVSNATEWRQAALRVTDRPIQENRAVAEKPHDVAVKFDTYDGKLTAASRSSPCDSTALVINSTVV